MLNMKIVSMFVISLHTKFHATGLDG